MIGVNSQIETGRTGEQGNVGVGFAIPINTVKDVASQLIRNGKVEHAFLGVRVAAVDPKIARLFKLPAQRGLLVQRVEQGSGAAKAGLRAGSTDVVVAGQSWLIGGDLIVEADGRPVSTLEGLRDVLSTKRPDDTLELDIYRGENRMTLKVKLGRQPSSPQS